jgi:hypothetical protein
MTDCFYDEYLDNLCKLSKRTEELDITRKDVVNLFKSVWHDEKYVFYGFNREQVIGTMSPPNYSIQVIEPDTYEEKESKVEKYLGKDGIDGWIKTSIENKHNDIIRLKTFVNGYKYYECNIDKVVSAQGYFNRFKVVNNITFDIRYGWTDTNTWRLYLGLTVDYSKQHFKFDFPGWDEYGTTFRYDNTEYISKECIHDLKSLELKLVSEARNELSKLVNVIKYDS